MLREDKRSALPTGRDQHVQEMFALEGEPMMTHPGRSVVRVELDGAVHYLKRYWLCPSQVFKRLVAQGFHELRMIDWLNGRGFAGPVVVDRGWSGFGPVRTRMFFLMREVPDELPLERYWRRNGRRADELVSALAAHAARLHDRGFYHYDFSERHIRVACDGQGRLSFRQIDLERARVGRPSEPRAAADLKTLACSIADEKLRRRIETDFVDQYLAGREPPPPRDRFLALLARARPTKTFN